MLLRPLPGRAEPDRPEDIGRTQNGRGFDTVSYPNYLDFRSRSTMFEDVYAIRVEPQPMSIAGSDGRFDQTNVDVIALDLSLARLRRWQRAAFHARSGESHPFATCDSASATLDLPLDSGRVGLGGLRVLGAGLRPGRESVDADWNVVEPEYFRALRLPLVGERDFRRHGYKRIATGGDHQWSAAAAVLAGTGSDRASARGVRTEGPLKVTIVGLAADAKLLSLTATAAGVLRAASSQLPAPSGQ